MIKSTSRRRITTAVALSAAGIAVSLPATSLAQQLEEVVVTAQKREQSLQDVSMSLSAFTGDALDVRAIEDMADLQFSVPNLLDDGARIAIRGIGNNAISSTAEGGLGYHFNGVYVNRPQTRSSDYFDIERVEVLRGPQGTLYGRNTTAGVINIISKKPTEELGGDLSLILGNYDTVKARGAINIPLTDNVRQRFAGSYNKRDGYNENIYNGNDVDGRDSYELRSSTAFDFGDNTTADLVISYLKEDSDRANQTKGTCTKDATHGCSALTAGFESPDVSGSLWQLLNGGRLDYALFPAGDYFADTVNPSDYRKVNMDQDPTYEVEQLGISLEIKHTVGDYTLTSLTGYYDTESDIFADFDRFVPSVPLNFPVTYKADGKKVETTTVIKSGRRDLVDADQFTQEFQISSEYDGSFNFLLGAFYYTEENVASAQFTHPTLAFLQQNGFPDHPNLESYVIETDPGETDSLALFGEGYFDLTEQTRLTVGLRYTDDEKSIRTRASLLAPDKEWDEAKADWQETTGKATIEHFFNDDSMLYATIARGYKAGGLNPGGAGEAAGGEEFEPEYINQFEIGTKNTFMDGRLRANLSAFFYDYEDMQIGTVVAASGYTANADAEVLGAEAEFIFMATDALSIDLNLAWLDTEIQEFVTADLGDPDAIAPGSVPALDENGDTIHTPPSPFEPNGSVVKDLEGNSLRNAPENSVALGVQYAADIFDNYQLTARLDHFWQDEYYAFEANKPSDVIDSWEQTNFQLVLEPAAGDWMVKAYVKNLSDNDDVIRRGQDGPEAGRFRSVTVLEPRTYGIELRMFFE